MDEGSTAILDRDVAHARPRSPTSDLDLTPIDVMTRLPVRGGYLRGRTGQARPWP